MVTAVFRLRNHLRAYTRRASRPRPGEPHHRRRRPASIEVPLRGDREGWTPGWGAAPEGVREGRDNISRRIACRNGSRAQCAGPGKTFKAHHGQAPQRPGHAATQGRRRRRLRRRGAPDARADGGNARPADFRPRRHHEPSADLGLRAAPAGQDVRRRRPLRRPRRATRLLSGTRRVQGVPLRLRGARARRTHEPDRGARRRDPDPSGAGARPRRGEASEGRRAGVRRRRDGGESGRARGTGWRTRAARA